VKTANRTEGGSEVIVPIIEPLQRILDEIAAEPVLNGFVFPDILRGATLKIDKRKRISQENSNVQDRVIKICHDVLHWEVRPSGTWCRHSYGTNLSHARVEEKYISESMGHSTSKSITDRYIAQYPLETQFEYNSRLLDTEPKITADDIKKMTEEEKTNLILELLSKRK
jgi:integrase